MSIFGVMRSRSFDASAFRLRRISVIHIQSLVAVTESEARQYAKERTLPIISCCCPACGDLSLQRQRIKRLIAQLEVEHPDIKSSMIRAIGNVASRHLLDRRLHPLPESSDLVAQSGAVPLQLVKR